MPELDRYLEIAFTSKASDIHLTAGMAPLMRLHGRVQPMVPGHAPLAPEALERMLLELAPAENRREFETTSDTDFAHEHRGVARFRVNLFRDLAGPGAVLRQIPREIPTVEQLGLPKAVVELCDHSKGLVLVTGPTGSGKSTTLAALIDHVNRTRDDHILTIEDPVEFVHPSKRALVNQREVGTHSESFARALRAALREDPNLIMVGELRDLETVKIALELAETGHLVFATLHTNSAASTVDRIIDQFPPEQQGQVRTMLADSLRGVVTQTLLKRQDGRGRVAALEVLVSTPSVAANIREGKSHQIGMAMQTGKKLGMVLLNESLVKHVLDGTVTPEEALHKATDKAGLLKDYERLGVAWPPAPEAPKLAAAPLPPAPAPVREVGLVKTLGAQIVSKPQTVRRGPSALTRRPIHPSR